MENHLSTTTSDSVALASAETASAVSWGAVFAGASATLAVSFVVVALMGGLGLKVAGPWPGARAEPGSFTPILGAVMVSGQVLSSALGGYLAGRLRTKWTNVHGHEVHFRDTAHGFLAWAVSVIMAVALAATAAPRFVDPAPAAFARAAAARDEVAALDAAGVAATTPEEAALRVRLEREANLAAQFSFFMGIGLLLGAFTASVAAAIGGLRREEMHGLFWREQTRAGAPEAR